MADDNKDKTAWPGLLNAAKAGTLEFDPTAAAQGAGYCSDLIGQLLALKKIAEGAGLDSLKDIGTLSSGKLLTHAFNQSGTALINDFDAHVAVLTDMGDTFYQAGRAYLMADDGNADRFKEITMPTKATDLNSKPPGAKDPNDIDDSVHMSDDLKKFRDDKAKAKVGIEPHLEGKKSLSWGDMYNLGVSMDPGPYATAGETWKWLSEQTDKYIGDFQNNVQTLDGTWKSTLPGSGSDAAQAAVKQYCADLGPFVETMKTTGDLLNFTSTWMTSTQENMPYQEEEPDCADPDTDDYRDKWNHVYHDPLGDTAATVPKLAVPTPLPTPTKPTTDGTKPTTDGTKPTTDGTKPTTDGTKPTTDGTKPTTDGTKPTTDGTKPTNDGSKDTGGSHSGGGGGDGSGGGTASQYKAPNVPPLENKPDPNAAKPNGSNPNGTNPNGTNPNGTNPNGTNPNGTNPSGTNPNGTNPNSSVPQAGTASGSSGSGSDMSQLTSVLSSLMSGVTTGISTVAQQLPSILQALESMHSTDL
ncbi:hypothetical protein ACWELQ_44705, partial [Nocardia sp. NPDC004722]